MVNDVTSLTGNGLKDWLIQRVSAVFLAAYSLFLLGYLFMHPHMDHSVWYALFHTTWFQIASIIALFTLSMHAWIGVWTVTTDYIKCTAIRISVQLLVALLLLGQFIWGLMIVWG
jgi:succinate dehydrogenase / fumarate reductase membrane anchor subunit